MRYMTKSERFFNEEEMLRIKETTRSVELQTIGEVAVMVVDSSDRYIEAELTGAIIFGSLFSLIITTILFSSSMWVYIPLSFILFFLLWFIFYAIPVLKTPFIRFKRKVKSIIDCAKSFELIHDKYGSFKTLLSDIPKGLKSKTDVESFWKGFNDLKKIMGDVKMPFFRSSTSLLHLLLHIGFPCIKPDLIVMRVAKKIGIVDFEKGERNLLQSVKVIQLYSVDKDIKPSIVDLYLLIYGGQRWAMQFVTKSFYENKR